MRPPALFALATLICSFGNAASPDFRPPAVPLVAHNPYFSIWSMADHLTDEPTKHWTGAKHSLSSLVRVDGSTYRLMGVEPRHTPALPQTHLDVLPTRTVYQFEGAGIHIDLTFLTPALTNDLDLLSRPATYLNWQARSTDGAQHHVEIYFDAGSEIAVNTTDEPVVLSRYRDGEMDVLRVGSQQQPVLQKSGDNLRIDWGYLYLVANPGPNVADAVSTRDAAMKEFAAKGTVPANDDFRAFKPYAQPEQVLAVSFGLDDVGATPVSRHAVLAYDDEYSVAYFERRLRPYWRRNGEEALPMLKAALSDYESLDGRCHKFDESLMADLASVGGEEYAKLCALAYRQTLAANMLVADLDGAPLYFSKENFSNGSIDTVDITYPSSPFFLFFNPKLLAGQIRPIMDYASLPRWKFPFAPHDLGRYPLANGQQYGGGEMTEEDQMPVEESGNMILMTAAYEQFGGGSDLRDHYWPLLTKWAEYLKSEGLDPANQLCTDDFAGHLAHNANLSIKAILALDAYGEMAKRRGDKAKASEYQQLAKQYAAKWMEMAADGDHFRLAFDRPGTWSQKYNLVWDKLLHLNVFPDSVAEKELRYYAGIQNTYGLPLDNRATYTKLDWLAWTASLSNSKAQFESLYAPAYRFANESSSRVPLSDFYDTKSGKQVAFQARSVVGGIFIRALDDAAITHKYDAAVSAVR